MLLNILLKELKDKFKNFDTKKYGEEIVEKIERLKKEVLYFNPERFVEINLDRLKEIKENVLKPKKEKELIEKFKKNIKKTKEKILNTDIEREGKLYKSTLIFIYNMIRNDNISSLYKEINAYYPIIRMFFLFFEPKKIVDILSNAL